MEVTLNPAKRFIVWVLARTIGAQMWDADSARKESPVRIKWDATTEPGFPYTVALHGKVVYYAPDASDAVRHGMILLNRYA